MGAILISIFALMSGQTGAGAAEPKKMVIIGDSLTEGYGVSREQAYPALLQKKLEQENKNWRVTNAGISGSTSASALSRVQWHLKQKPDLLILALGANDGLRGTSTTAMQQNLEAAVAEAQNAGVRVILVGMKMAPNYGAAYTKSFDEVFPSVARKFKIPLVPFLLNGVAGKPSLNLTDGIHPNERGYEIVADALYKQLKSYL